ncbi:MAG: MFS transporter [Rhodospirillaceae bacterium]|nr:MFS transporter [Rhodospirillaceae bacterium]
MLVLLHFHTLGYTPFQLAALFLLYEVMGMVTNLAGGWLGSRYGLKITLYMGLILQILALLGLSALDNSWSLAFSVTYVLMIQGVSGIAKDLSKMSSKSAVKLMVPEDAHSVLLKWVAVLTGSKNALKGMGFFIGGVLLAVVGFVHALWLMAGCLTLVLLAATLLLPPDMGKVKGKVRISEIFSKSREIKLLSAARMFLFGARDVWFAVGLPVFLHDVLGWSFAFVGGFLAAWLIGYGLVQGVVPVILRSSRDGRTSEFRAARIWIFILAAVTVVVAGGIHAGNYLAVTLIVGLGLFGFCFAVNSSVHSYLILALSGTDKVAMSVGFYYSANAAGRFGGTLLSGIAYQWSGLIGCLSFSAAMLMVSCLFTVALGAAQTPESKKLSAR